MANFYEEWLKWWFWWLPEPVVTRLEAEDAPDCALLHAASFHQGWPAHDLETMINNEAMLAYGLRHLPSQPPFGFLLVRRTLDEAEIMTICIHPDMRGRGHGRRLLQALWPDLIWHGVKTLFLEVEAGNTAAIALYNRHGFKEFGRRKDYYAAKDGRQDAVLMHKSL